MKNIEEYIKLIEEKTQQKARAKKKRRFRVVSLCIAAFLCVGAAVAVPALMGSKPEPGAINTGAGKETVGSENVGGLREDESDLFILGNSDYAVVSGDPAGDRILFSGLRAFSDGDRFCFSLNEDGKVWSFDGEELDIAKKGSFNAHLPMGIYFGADSRGGFVYMPAVNEVGCGGGLHCNGICRCDLSTFETECVIAGEDRISSVKFVGDRMYYASVSANGEVLTVKFCDLNAGKIYVAASVRAPEPDPLNSTAEIIPCAESLAVLWNGRLFLISPDGACAVIADGVEAAAAGNGRIFAFSGLGEGRGRLMFGLPDCFFADYFFAHWDEETVKTDIYSAAGEKLGEYEADGFRMTLVVHDGRLVAAKDNDLYLIDPLSGEAEMVIPGVIDRFYAADLNGRLLVVNYTGYEVKTHIADRNGRVYVLSGTETAVDERLPVYSASSVKLLFYDDIPSAVEELLYEPVAIPVDFENCPLQSIRGKRFMNTTPYDIPGGVIYKGFMEIIAGEGPKSVTVWVMQTERRGSYDHKTFAQRLGYDADNEIDRALKAGEEFPLFLDNWVSAGKVVVDLITNGDEPTGVFSYIVGEDGAPIDGDFNIGAYILDEKPDYTAAISVSFSGFTPDEARALIKY